MTRYTRIGRVLLAGLGAEYARRPYSPLRPERAGARVEG